MNRAQFLSLFAIPFLPKVDLPKNDNVFAILRNGEIVGTVQNSITFEHNGGTYIHDRSAQEVMRIFSETGIILWSRNRPNDQPQWTAIHP